MEYVLVAVFVKQHICTQTFGKQVCTSKRPNLRIDCMGKIGSKGEIGFCADIISHFSLAIFSLLQLLCVFDFFLMLVHFDDVLKEP